MEIHLSHTTETTPIDVVHLCRSEAIKKDFYYCADHRLIIAQYKDSGVLGVPIAIDLPRKNNPCFSEVRREIVDFLQVLPDKEKVKIGRGRSYFVPMLQVVVTPPTSNSFPLWKYAENIELAKSLLHSKHT